MEFLRTRDGHEAAIVGDTVYGILPARFGVMLAFASLGRNKVSDLVKESFYGPSFFDTADLAKADLADIVASKEEIAKLNRRSVPADRRRTPWGVADHATEYGPGVISYSTPGHGGFKLERAQNAKVDPELRREGGWYEEDQDWCLVAVSFPELFSARERRHADNTFRNWMPDQYESFHGVVLQEGQSFKKDERIFAERHKDDWVVISASRNDDGTIRCWATKGGERRRHDGPEIEEKIFVVPGDEYEARGRHGFVVDPSVHPEEGASPAPGM